MAAAAAVLCLAGCGPIHSLFGAPPAPDATQRAELQARLSRLENEAAQQRHAKPAKGEIKLESTGRGEVKGYIAADEPQAIPLAEDILRSGGSAADAAVTLFFSLNVTLPSAVSLGGGGLCLVRDRGAVESIEFLAKAPPGGGAIAVPGALAGIAYLHMHYGALRWSADVSPAERLPGAARISHALAEELAKLPSTASQDAGFAKLRTRPDGTPLAEGDYVEGSDLAGTLAQIRANGVGVLYGGPLGRALVLASQAKGGTVTLSDLANFHPTVSRAALADFQGVTVYIPGAASGAGQLLAASLKASQNASDPDAVEAAVGASLTALGAPPGPATDYGSTSFLVVDARGEAVACGLTLNGPFGARAVVPGTGIVMANNPAISPEGYAGAFLDPVIAEEPKTARPFLVASAASGPSSIAAMVDSIIVALKNPSFGAHSILSEIARNGSPTGNLFVCAVHDGERNACNVASDPNGFGFGEVVHAQ